MGYSGRSAKRQEYVIKRKQSRYLLREESSRVRQDIGSEMLEHTTKSTKFKLSSAPQERYISNREVEQNPDIRCNMI